MSTTLKGASLAFEAGRVDVQLPQLLEAFEPQTTESAGPGLKVPSIAVPEVSDDDIPLDALGELALKEILSHARSGTAQVRLPLLPVTFKKGPFSFTLPDDAVVVIDLVVEEGHIIKDATKGRIEPPLQLPLGVKVQGVYLDDDGSLIAALSGFVDLNLSFLALSGLKVPPTLKEVIDRALGDEDTRVFKRDDVDSVDETASGPKDIDATPPALPDDGDNDSDNDNDNDNDSDALPPAAAEGSDTADVVVGSGDDAAPASPAAEAPEGEDDATPIDLQRLSVEARDVLAHLTPLTLGDAGRLVPGEGTRFDVDFSLKRIRVHGAVELQDGEVHAGGFAASGLNGKGVVDWVLHDVTSPSGMSLDFACERGRFDRARVELKNGSHVELEDVSIRDAQLHVKWSVAEDGGHDVVVDVKSGDAQGRLTSGEVHAGIGGQDLVATVTPCSAQGSLHVVHDSKTPSRSMFHVDVEVEDAGARIDRLHTPLGIAVFDLQNLQARGRGRFRAATDMGFAFSGVVGVEGEVFDGTLDLGPVHAHIVEGSRAQFSVRDVAASATGLEALVAHGQLDVRLASGSLPLSDAIAVQFSRGAAGRVVFDEVTYLPDVGAWPVLQGSGNMMARADPIELPGLLSLPSGNAHIQLGRFSVSPQGELVLEQLRTWLSSSDLADDPSTR